MIKRDKVFKAPGWSKNCVNRWADYVEFMCLYSKDHIYSKDDLIDILAEGNSDELKKGEEDHPLEFDRLSKAVESFFDMIRYRKQVDPEFYPFEIDGDCIILLSELSLKQLHYIFLLSRSSIYFVDRLALHKMTGLFEKYCQPIMHILMPVGAQTELFGTSRENAVFNGSLKNRITQLASFLGAQTTKTLDSAEKYDRIHAGDGGLDIVSFLKLDGASHIPFAFGQCTCSYDDWIFKQTTLDTQSWHSKIDPLAPYWKFMYVPFYCHDALGRFEDPTEIHTCLIDRQRILIILNTHQELFYEYAKMDLQDILKEFWT